MRPFVDFVRGESISIRSNRAWKVISVLFAERAKGNGYRRKPLACSTLLSPSTFFGNSIYVDKSNVYQLIPILKIEKLENVNVV